MPKATTPTKPSLILNEQEVATVLAALRFWQDAISDTPPDLLMPEHFQGVKPLTADQIDSLCESLHLP
ncbi:MAG TPA: hypothetical protein VHH73_03330 [Verrucomicrobiae bacterium]|nr:hypothetical protein [Verrucomicrobiae bacterium]